MTVKDCDRLFRGLHALQRKDEVRMNAKAKGTRNEHKSIALLEAAGYRCTRAAASLGCWDIIGVGSTDVVLVQTKTRDWPATAEMETLKAFPAPPWCEKLVHAGAIVNACRT
jgi:hypothetical protein